MSKDHLMILKGAKPSNTRLCFRLTKLGFVLSKSETSYETLHCGLTPENRKCHFEILTCYDFNLILIVYRAISKIADQLYAYRL